MAKTLQVDIVTPEKRFFSGEASFIAVPAALGEMGFYPKHVPVATFLGSGDVRVTSVEDGSIEHFAVTDGYIELKDDKVIVLATEAAKLADVDVQELKTEIASFEKELAGLSEDDISRRAYAQKELDFKKLQLHLLENK